MRALNACQGRATCLEDDLQDMRGVFKTPEARRAEDGHV